MKFYQIMLYLSLLFQSFSCVSMQQEEITNYNNDIFKSLLMAAAVSYEKDTPSTQKEKTFQAIQKNCWEQLQEKYPRHSLILNKAIEKLEAKNNTLQKNNALLKEELTTIDQILTFEEQRIQDTTKKLVAVASTSKKHYKPKKIVTAKSPAPKRNKQPKKHSVLKYENKTEEEFEQVIATIRNQKSPRCSPAAILAAKRQLYKDFSSEHNLIIKDEKTLKKELTHLCETHEQPFMGGNHLNGCTYVFIPRTNELLIANIESSSDESTDDETYDEFPCLTKDEINNLS